MKRVEYLIGLLLLALAATVPLILLAEENTELSITETVFAYQFKNIGDALDVPEPVYCLEVKKADPSTALLKRFVGHMPLVKKGSQCTSDIAGVVDKDSGRSGILFYVTKIIMLNESEAIVDGGYYQNGKNASLILYYLTHDSKRNKWIVKERIVRLVF